MLLTDVSKDLFFAFSISYFSRSVYTLTLKLDRNLDSKPENFSFCWSLALLIIVFNHHHVAIRKTVRSLLPNLFNVYDYIILSVSFLGYLSLIMTNASLLI